MYTRGEQISDIVNKLGKRKDRALAGSQGILRTVDEFGDIS